MEPLVVISSDKKRRVRRTAAVGVMLKVSFVLLDSPAIVKLAINIYRKHFQGRGYTSRRAGDVPQE